MNPRRTFAITTRLLTQFRHDRRTLVILFVTPIVVLGLFALLFRADAPDPRVGVVIEGEGAGEGAFGDTVTDALSDADEIVVEREASAADAEQRLRDGDLDAVLVLPGEPDAGDVLRVELTVEGTDQSVAPMVASVLQEALVGSLGSLVPSPPPGTPAGPGAPDLPDLPQIEVEVSTLHGGGEDLDTLDLFGGPFIGLVVFFLVYVVTSVSFLRERSQGTLERLMASPLRRTEIVVGYMLGFLVVALIQAAEVLVFGVVVLDLYNAGSVWLLFGIEMLLALAAVNLGIFLSTFARSEFQAIQFLPLVIVPQILLSGLLVPVEHEPEWLQIVSNALPLTYAVDALRDVMLRGADLSSSSVQLDLAVLGGFCVLVIVAGAATLRREVA
jgi:ABC-2 type transport system permease protein